MKVSLEGKAIVVTGAASGIGAAIAKAARDAGAEVFFTDRQPIPDAPSATVDLAQPEGPETVIKAAIAHFGRIDGLVNAAGLTTRGSVMDGTAEVWDQLFAVNAKAGFLLMQGAIRDMRRLASGGAIVNILSMNAHCGSPELGIYAASKGAMLTLTKNAAHAHMAEGIRVNGINLGWVATPSEHHMQEVVLGRGSDWAKEASAGLPLGRMVEAQEAARLAVYLLSDASIPMSGVALDLEQHVTGALT